MSPNGNGPLFSICKYFIFLCKFIVTSIRRHTFDIIHVHYYYPTIILAVIYRLFVNRHVKIIVTFHGSDVYKYKHPPFLYRYLFKFVNHSIFVSKHLVDNIKIPIDKNKHSTLSVGAKYLEPNIGDDIFDFSFIGTIDDNKKIIEFINIANNYNKKQLNIVIAGYCIREKEFKKAIEESIHKIKFLGTVNKQKVFDIFNQSRFSLNLSTYESFGLSITESMLVGTPVVATNTDGSTEQIIDNENGYIINFNDREILQVLDLTSTITNEKYSELSYNAKKSSEKFLLSEVIEQLENLYDGVCNE
ncbi:glycosyltransferase family 4 protein [Photobacterium aphoticum]|nr:glycosyltransferase family 4 protein [Photobacterium aphoticum]